MPIYVYKCPECKYVDELIQQYSKQEVPYCSRCGESYLDIDIPAPLMERVFCATGTSFRLKGHGWEKDGYSSKPPKKIKKDG